MARSPASRAPPRPTRVRKPQAQGGRIVGREIGREGAESTASNPAEIVERSGQQIGGTGRRESAIVRPAAVAVKPPINQPPRQTTRATIQPQPEREEEPQKNPADQSQPSPIPKRPTKMPTINPRPGRRCQGPVPSFSSRSSQTVLGHR